jgi:MinD-like ATPase involved in chromosome partitioning or flagellar assembly
LEVEVTKLTELILVVGCDREGIINALKTKVLLQGLGLGVIGVMLMGGNEEIPEDLVEDILRLKVMPASNPIS